MADAEEAQQTLQGSGQQPEAKRSPPEGDSGSAAPKGLSDDHSSTPPDSSQPPVEPSPGFAERGRMRRRARFLRRARELAYRDLGGLVFDLHRFGQRNDQLVLAKLAMLRQVDTEVRELEAALGERRSVTVLREVGIAVCPRCAAIHDSDDRFCARCGLAFDAHADRPLSTVQATPPSPPQTAPTPGAMVTSSPASAPSAGAPPAKLGSTAAPGRAESDAKLSSPSTPAPATLANPVAPGTGAPAAPARPPAGEPVTTVSRPGGPLRTGTTPSRGPGPATPERASEDEPTQILRPQAPEEK